MRRLLTLLLTCGVVAAATAAPVSSAVRIEIDQLMSKLEASGCEFNRNGTWHTGTEAKSHLLRKLGYLEERNSVQTTEQFVELAASTSSTTGQPYLVKCGNGPAIESRAWLLSELRAIRMRKEAGR